MTTGRLWLSAAVFVALSVNASVPLAGEAYTSRLKAPCAGKWKLVARLGGRYIHRQVEISQPGEPFVFRSPAAGVLDYLLTYLWDRTDKTPKSLWTPMDVYREVIR